MPAHGILTHLDPRETFGNRQTCALWLEGVEFVGVFICVVFL